MRKAKILIDDAGKVHYVPVQSVKSKIKGVSLVGALYTARAANYLKRGVTNFTTQTVTTVKDTPKAVVHVGSSVRETVHTARIRRIGRKTLFEQVGRATEELEELEDLEIVA